MHWLAALLNRSADATKMEVDRHKVPSAATRLNACASLLRIARPVVGHADREANAAADLGFLTESPLGRAAYPADLTRINFEFANAAAAADAGGGPAPMDESDDDMYDDDDGGGDDDAALAKAIAMSVEAPPRDFHFVTTAFFLAARGLHLGMMAELSKYDEYRSSYAQTAHFRGSDHPQTIKMHALVILMEAGVLADGLLEDGLAFAGFLCRWLARLDEDDFRKAPEHALEDVASLPALVAKYRPNLVKRGEPLRDLLRVITRCLGARERLVRSPHARDKLAQALFECYLPQAAKGEYFRHRPNAASEANVALLLAGSGGDGTAELAPAVLWLFGDAEHLGAYDVAPARIRLAAIIKHLWASPHHRGAFRDLAGDKRAFVTFANGLLNETNRLVGDTMERLPQIRDHQVRTGVAPAADADARALRREYADAPDARREELDERFADIERHLEGDLRLCTETLALVELLTEDEVVREAFSAPELRPRLADMLLSVMRAFTGKRSLDIKIESPEKYGFDPRDILARVGRIAARFAKTDAFSAAIAESGFFARDLLPKCVATLRRIRSLDDGQLEALAGLAAASDGVKDDLASRDAAEADAPEEFLDALMFTLMEDPVELPSGHVVDSTTIQQHLLNEESNPFNRAPMAPSDPKPRPDLKAKITAWLATHKK